MEIPSLTLSPAAAVRFSYPAVRTEGSYLEEGTYPFRTSQVYKMKLRGHRDPLAALFTSLLRATPSGIR